MPCRACGREFLKVTVAEGSHALKCPGCGRTTTARVKCKGDACQVATELADSRESGAASS